MRFVKIACALFNRYFDNIQEERPEHKEIAKEMLAKVHVENVLQREILEKGYEKRLLVAHWEKASASESCLDDFPILTLDELRSLFFGDYQLNIGQQYVTQHMKPNGSFEIYIYRHEDMGNVIAAKLHSRFRSAVKHLMWIKYDPNITGKDAIVGMYCKCQVGSRTVGSCSHTAGVRKHCIKPVQSNCV